MPETSKPSATDSLSRKIADAIMEKAAWIGRTPDAETMAEIIASELAEREKAVEAAIQALEVAQLWLANSMSVTDIAGPKPLPLIAAALSGLGVRK